MKEIKLAFSKFLSSHWLFDNMDKSFFNNWSSCGLSHIGFNHLFRFAHHPYLSFIKPYDTRQETVFRNDMEWECDTTVPLFHR